MMDDNIQQFLKSADFKCTEQEFRMLNPSPDSTFIEAKLALKNCCISLTENPNSPTSKKLGIIKSSIKQVSKSSLDTEDREYVAYYFHKLGGLVGVNASSQVNNWLYGSILALLFKLLGRG